MTAPIWSPGPDAATSRLGEFGRAHGFDSYGELWNWSVTDLPAFWGAVWDFFEVESSRPYDQVLADDRMPGAVWFPGTAVNYAEHALRAGNPGDPALVAVGEGGFSRTLTRADLRAEVAALAGWLTAQGVGIGDRVVGYLPNGAHAVIGFLATASIGAVWSVCGQDYGAAGAAARFAQLEPVVLIAADGYPWNGKVHDRRAEAAELRELLPTLCASVSVGQPLAGTTPWDEAIATPAPPRFVRVPFDHPLWVLFSSGTTGVPKGIVHGHGGVLLEHLKLLGLHLDLREGERLLWYTTTNWMMWNMVVSALLVGATAVLYDGSPVYPTPARLWELAAEVEVLGVSPGYLSACAAAGVEPGPLNRLRVLGSTGSPLPAAAYHWVAEHVGKEVQVVSTTGGTDVVSGFAGSAPSTPIWPGEISAPLLGVALDAWDPDGKPLVGDVGELVVTRPMPSMPVYFWNDPDGARYRDAYYCVYPGVWRHGDWITVTDRGSVIVTGRSDSTLNRHGVRLGSADVYAVVEALPEVAEALVIGAELADGGYWMPLFVVPAAGYELDDALRARIVEAIRTQASPRHVPDEILAVPGIPHTRTGKKLEVPVKRLAQGAALDRVLSRDAVDDPDLLDFYVRLLRRTE